MTGRVDAQDTDADRRIREVLDRRGKAGFIVTAGAGSGKTTSLVKALAHVAATRRKQLRARTQRVACITYTEVAAAEIHGDVQDDPLVYVSTIHSFLWEAIAPFQADIGAWIEGRLTAKLNEIDGKIEKTRAPAKHDAMAQDRVRYERQLDALRTVRKFTYGVGPDYGRGQIGHADVLKMVPQMLIEQPLLAKVVASRFPIIFVDESQDTDALVVRGLIHVYKTAKDFCLGFFGDTMQQIYPTGIGRVPAEPDWMIINKPENFRSSRRVLEVVNRVRAAADGDQQTPGRPEKLTPDGHAYFFVLPADADRVTSMDAVRRWLALRTSNDAWTSDAPGGAKILVAMHKLAARRLGFANLHAAFHPPNPPTLAKAFIEGTAWPIAPFANVILPLCDVSDDGVTLRILRKHSSLLRGGGLAGAGVARARLTSAREAVTELRGVVAEAGPGSVGRALWFAHRNGLIDPVPQLARYLDPDGPHSDQVLSEKTREVLDAFMACDVHELEGYLRYVSRQSPYSTQHATKGAEFPRVIVLLDDSEGALPSYSYDKLLGLAELSEKDRENKANGKDTTVERSRRLLYVCVSRAREELAVVIYTDNVESAILSLKVSKLADQPLTLSDLTSELSQGYEQHL